MQKIAAPIFPRNYCVGTLLIASMPFAFAAAGDPLPRCSASSQDFYLLQYEEQGALTPPKTTLSMATVPPTGGVTLNQVWDGETAPVPSLWDTSGEAGASVAAGMGKDGYIYAMRAVGNDPAWVKPAGSTAPVSNWQTHTRYYEMLRYGNDGVDNLGIVEGLGTYIDEAGITIPGEVDFRLGPNFNAADIDPVSGIMYLGMFRTGGPLNKLFKIDVSQTPPQYVDTLLLSAPIPGEQSGDFAIDATGQWAYGIAIHRNGPTSTSYRINLASGNLEVLETGLGILPFGAAARLPNDATKMAFYNGSGTQIMSLPGGTLGALQSTPISTSTDAAACQPKWAATLQCNTTSLTDSAGSVAQCTVTLNQAAPAGGFAIGLVPPAISNRYSSTCGNSLTIAEGQTTAQCTITATANTMPGDGSVNALLALAAPSNDAEYEVVPGQSQVDITVQDDEQAGPAAITPVPTLGQWALLLLSMALAGFAAMRFRRS